MEGRSNASFTEFMEPCRLHVPNLEFTLHLRKLTFAQLVPTWISDSPQMRSPELSWGREDIEYYAPTNMIVI